MKTAKLWSINELSDETGLDRRTITKLLAGAEGVSRGKVLVYRLRDLIEALRAVEDDEEIRAERLRKIKEEADAVAMKNAKGRRELVDLGALQIEKAPALDRIKRYVTESVLPESDKEKFLNGLAECFQ